MTSLLKGKPVVRHAVEAALGSSADEVLVVTGHDEANVRDALLDHPVRYVANPDFESGMASSIVRGIAAVEGSEEAEVSAALICLGDMPSISSATIDALIRSFESSKRDDAIVVPTYEARGGHPVLFGAAHFEALRGLSGDRGARAILQDRRGHGQVIEVACDDAGIRHDVDRPSDLAAMSSRPNST